MCITALLGGDLMGATHVNFQLFSKTFKKVKGAGEISIILALIIYLANVFQIIISVCNQYKKLLMRKKECRLVNRL